MKTHRTLVAITSAFILCAGCNGSGGEQPFAAEDFEVGRLPSGYGGTDDPPSGYNGKDPKCFWDHGTQEGLRTLGSGALDFKGNGQLQSLPSVAPHCRPIIEATIECALDQSQKIYDPDSGLTYFGWWGLATAWEKNPILTKDGDYVTACVLQRLNAFGKVVNVLLEGDTGLIKEDLAADVDFPFHESTVYGNMFTSKAPLYTNRPAFDAFVCSEDELAQTCRKSAGTILDTRICDTTTFCGFNYLGPCSSPTLVGASCPPNGPYWACNVPGQALGAGVRVQLQYNPHGPTVCY